MDLNCIPRDKLILYPPCDYSCDDTPPRHRRSHEFDPHNPPEQRVKPDPRPRLPCGNKVCCACRPAPLPKKPIIPNLKLRQLADCYSCRVSEGCHNRRKVFYDRWQTHLDKMPPMPNTDYKVYCCDDYVDLGVNNDFLKFDRFLGARKPPREETLEYFLWMKNLGEVNAEVKGPAYECVPHEPYWVYNLASKKDPLGLYLNKRTRLYHEDGISRWNEIRYQPEYQNFVEGCTPYNSRIRPFRRDVSFSTPVDTSLSLSSGNESPFKEIRDAKYAL